MKRILLVAFAVLPLSTACNDTDPVSAGSTASVSATPEVTASSAPLRVVCHAATRPSATASPTGTRDLMLTGPEAEDRVTAQGMTLRARYRWDPYGEHSLNLDVSEGTRAITRGLYQLGTSVTVPEFGGGHGFTGLGYAYSGRGAELQHWCEIDESSPATK